MARKKQSGTSEQVHDLRASAEHTATSMTSKPPGSDPEGEDLYRRVRDLASLNQVGQNLNKLSETLAILNLLAETIHTMLETGSLFIGLYDETLQDIQPQIYTREGVPADQALADIEKAAALEGMRVRITSASSAGGTVLTVPLLAGHKLMGVAVATKKTGQAGFDSSEMDAVVTVCSQAAIALENSRLIREMQAALSELATRERYQNLVAHAVAGLNARGTASLDDVVMNLASAAQSDRVEFLVQVPATTLWKRSAIYQREADAPAADGDTLYSMPTDIQKSMQVKGWVNYNPGRVNNNPESRELPETVTKDRPSCLLLDVPVRGRTEGILKIDAFADGQEWDNEEIKAFCLVATSLSNTLHREALVHELEEALAETEAIYQAAHQIALATNLTAMLNALLGVQKDTGIDQAEVVLFNDKTEDSFFKYRVSTVWNAVGGSRQASPDQYYPFATYHNYFEPEQPVFIDNIPEDGELSDDARQILSMEGKASSLGIIPLTSVDRRLGLVLCQSLNTGVFKPFLIRTLPLLAAQMAVAIDNLNLMQETRTVVDEKDSLYQASADVALAQSFDEILEVLRRHTFMGLSAKRMQLNIFDQPSTDAHLPDWMEIRAAWSSNNKPTPAGMVSTGSIPLAKKILNPDAPAILDETQPPASSLLPIVQDFLAQQGAIRAVYLPLVTANSWIGLVEAYHSEYHPVSDVELRTAMILAGQAALAVKNQVNLELARKNAAEATILFQASQQFAMAGSEKDIFQAALQAIRQALPVQAVTIHISVADQGKPSMRQAAGLAEPGIPLQRDGSLFPARLFPYYDFFMARQSTISPDTQRDERLTDTARRYFQMSQTYSVVVVPLAVRGQTYGVILASRNKNVPFSAAELVFLENVAAQAGIALENFRLLLETRASAREAHEKTLELSTINRVVASVSAAADIKAGLQAVIDELVETFSLSSGGIALLTEDKSGLTIYAERNRDGRPASSTIIPVKNNPSTQRVLETGKPLIITDAQHNPLTAMIQALMINKRIETLTLLPLIVNNEVIGTVGMDIQEPGRVLSEDEIRLSETIVFQAAVAIQNSRLLEQTQKALAEAELLYQISRSVAAASTTRELLDLVFENALPAAAEQVIFMFTQPILAEDGREIEIAGKRSRGQAFIPDGSRIPEADLPILGLVGAQPLVINDYKSADLDTRSIETLIRLDFVSGFILALKSSGEATGYLLVSSSQTVSYSPADLRRLQITADGIAVALEKQRLFLQAERRAVELQTAALVARETSGTLDLDVLLKRMVNLLCERFGFYHASVFLVDDEGEFAVVRESTGLAGEEMKARGHKLAVGSRSVMGSVTASGKSLVVNDVSRSATHRKNPLLPKTCSELGIPLKIGERVVGALDVQSTQVNAFHPDDVAVMQILADQIAVAIENAKAYTLSLQAVEDMRQADKMKSKFLANMSHELRTPLNSIIGFSRVILKGIDGPVTDIQQQDLTAIYNSGQHLLRLINDILDLSKIEAGKMELSFTDINVTELVNSVMSTVTGFTKDKPLKIVRNIPPDLPPVRGDSVRLRQVLINLISNAAKFTDHGTITIEASQQTAPSGQPEVIIKISDTGQGISPEHQRKLFQPFSQVDDSPTRKTGGTGLGLSISKSLVDMHGGRIGLEKSRVNEGSTFFFTLPVSGNISPLTSGSPAALTILAIDPDLRVIRQYQSFLEPKGYQVIPLADASAAGYHAQRLKPLAVILDVSPRDHSGWKAVKQLRADPETASVPMILCSYIQEEEIGLCLGITEFLNKPLKSESLTAAFTRLGLNNKFRELLIVNDNLEDLKAIQQAFENQPNTFLTFAKDAWQARALLAKRKPSAVIMDLIKPDLYRLDLIKELRANAEYGNIPMIFLIGPDRLQENIDQLDQFNQELLTRLYTKPESILQTLDKILTLLQIQPKS